MFNQPIYNPPNPYAGLVPGGTLQNNVMVKVNGTVRPGANQFAINLQLGPRVNPRDDLALHLSPVFTHPQRVVRNSLQNLTWGPEESHGGNPFTPGQQFEVIILVEFNAYKIAINGSHFTEFAHRLPFNHVSYLTIDGDVNINYIVYEMLNSSASHQPPPASSSMPYPAGAGSMGMPPYPSSGMPPYPPQAGGYNTGAYSAGINPQFHPNQPYPSSNPYPTQAGQSFVPPPVAYPSTSSGAYNAYPGAPPGYKAKKNKGILSGGGLLPAAGAIGGTILGASLLSRAVPKMKMFKGPKFFKHKGFKHKGFGFGGMMGKHKGWGKFKGPKFGKFKGPKW